jgi:S-DNA-T family DNA segregation ATPase FtsK/SpoIIIE
MSKPKKEKKKSAADYIPNPIAAVSSETKKSIIGILLIGSSIVLFLAAFGAAGPAGNFAYGLLNRLLGVGYYLIPIIALTVGVLFLISHEKKFFGIIFAGMAGFVLFSLGLIDVLFPVAEGAQATAGFLGRVVGAIESPFCYAAAIILLIMLVIVSLMITLNASLDLRKLKMPWRDEVDEDEDEEIEEEDLVVTGAAEVSTKKKSILSKQEEEPAKPAQAKEIDVKVADAPLINIGRGKLKEHANYIAPPLALLTSTVDKAIPGDIKAAANIIKRTLDSFGVPVEMGEVNVGPKVTRFTLKPAEGVKLTRITALAQDLSLSLAAPSLRIEAPIPGKSLVGIEVPNKTTATVFLGSMLTYPDFTGGGPLVFPLGRDVSGEPIFANLEKLPHMLVAGTTGSGKSIFIHSLLIPLLYKNSPDQLKMILIDPKRVELSIYEGIPHLIAPVITEAKKSIAVFRWAVSEMDRRYEMFMKAGARDIRSYNKNNKEEAIPFVMIVIDEMADLMSTFGKEIEGYIVRLAQMARATGIHLVLATQRPSVNVVTGLIKANIQARAALQVASQIDSRTIIDMAGAEKLLGKGDMLFVSNDYSKPKRIQSSFVAEEEIREVVSFIKEHNEVLTPAEPTQESQAITNAMAPSAPGVEEAKSGDIFDDYAGTNAGGGNDDEDEMLTQAIQTVKEAKKASASLLQRRLGVGYARAARLLDMMEQKGLIGPGDGAKPREVFIADDGVSAEGVPPEIPPAS